MPLIVSSTVGTQLPRSPMRRQGGAFAQLPFTRGIDRLLSRLPLFPNCSPWTIAFELRSLCA